MGRIVFNSHNKCLLEHWKLSEFGCLCMCVDWRVNDLNGFVYGIQCVSALSTSKYREFLATHSH